MAKLTAAQIAEAKAKGFLLNRGTENFSGRIVPHGCIFTAEDLIAVSGIAKKYGNGKIAFTTRLTAEIVGIPYEHIEEAIQYAKENSLNFGGTGAKIRPIAACKGTTCIYGNFDTQSMAADLYKKYYIGWSAIVLPHKFKIAIGGCPNSCMKPSLNDFGIEGHRTPEYSSELCRGCKTCQIEQRCPMKAATLFEGKLQISQEICKTCGLCTGLCPFQAVSHQSREQYQIYLGGTWGKHTRIGTPLPRLAEKEEIPQLLDKTLNWYKENANSKERLGAVMDRLGEAALIQTLQPK